MRSTLPPTCVVEKQLLLASTVGSGGGMTTTMMTTMVLPAMDISAHIAAFPGMDVLLAALRGAAGNDRSYHRSLPAD